MEVVLSECFHTTASVVEFASEAKRYEKTGFCSQELEQFYYECKAVYLLKSFGKQLQRKIEDIA